VGLADPLSVPQTEMSCSDSIGMPYASTAVKSDER
jgi:hypothetical protein